MEHQALRFPEWHPSEVQLAEIVRWARASVEERQAMQAAQIEALRQKSAGGTQAQTTQAAA